MASRRPANRRSRTLTAAKTAQCMEHLRSRAVKYGAHAGVDNSPAGHGDLRAAHGGLPPEPPFGGDPGTTL